ncbi:MAG TPA: helix-turn-helix transcriptional regulator [Actinomycetota bacterium]|nr:helix-turn-helix transcriptional regulator [Actinomycetota bacterium]
MDGDVDLAAVGELLADRSRCRMLLALGDGRALPASRLATEAGVRPATASSHLAKLVAGGFLTVEAYGRHRFYRLAGPAVGRIIEALAAVAPPEPVRSLRQSTRAAAVRAARTCYDHLAGRLGVGLMGAWISHGWLSGGDGRFHPGAGDRPSAYGTEIEYRLTPSGMAVAEELGMAGGRAVRYCVDWTEQRHHLSGPFGRDLLAHFVDQGWIRRSEGTRAVRVTPEGQAALAERFGAGLFADVGSQSVVAPVDVDDLAADG